MRQLVVVLGLLLAAVPALAAETGFTPEQRREIVQIVREALKSDPSILRDAVVSLQAEEQAREAADTTSRIAQKRQALVANPGDPVAGNPTGDVTLVEFYDPRCPYCRRVLPALDAMLKTDHGLRLVYKDIPVLGPASELETRAILAAQKQGAYGRMQDALMHNPAPPSAAMIAEAARGLGLNPTQLAADMDSPAVTQKIQGNLALARELNVTGTPVFIVGNTLIPGAVDQAALEAAVVKARKHS